MDLPKLVLRSGKDASLRRYHPWVFSGAIKKVYGNAREGQLVEVYDNKDDYLATGHYQEGSIAVRILSFKQDFSPEDLYRERIQKAFQYRAAIGLSNTEHTNTYRLIHAEGDGLPGLIIDIYGQVAVLQMHSLGMYADRELILAALKEVLGEQITTVYDKSNNTLPDRDGQERENSFLWGESTAEIVREYGYRFKVDFESGQKTGFFLDQRENRKLLEKYAQDREVLNMFCYTGGFSVYALKTAKRVVSVDSSGPAMDLTRENAELNFPGSTNHEAVVTDAFDYLSDIKDQFDLIILDPPAFAKSHRVLNNALQGYKRLNMKALEQIRSGGIIFTFSCSQAVSKENFRKSVFTAAANTGRHVRVLHQLHQPADHPVSLYHPEGEYLKGLVLYVE